MGIDVTNEQIDAYISGKGLIQDIFPDFTADERELSRLAQRQTNGLISLKQLKDKHHGARICNAEKKPQRSGQILLICLNDKVLRAYEERPSREEVNAMHRAVCNVLKEYTERME